ncbi:hypothetical protein Tco_1529500 [Tanacetum coccineum]
MSTHDEIFVTPSHTKKVFSNLKRVGKGFSGADTPLFPSMMVQAQKEMSEVDEAVNEENIPTHSNDPLLSYEDSLKLNDLMEICTKMQQRGRKIDDIDKDVEVTLVDETQGRYGDDLAFDISVLDGEEVFAGQDVVEMEVSTADPVTTVGEVVTIASVEFSVVKGTLVSAATTITITAINEVDLTLAYELAGLRSAKPKVVVQECNTPIKSQRNGIPL